jgi:hypothetical protein
MINPGISEDCTATMDQNCDGSTGTDDLDTDGFKACEECNDQNPEIHPEALEICDGLDNDCDGLIDDDDDSITGQSTFYLDEDGDGYGNPTTGTLACEAASDQLTDGTDCDDQNNTVHPGAIENCTDALDNDCNSATDAEDPVCAADSPPADSSPTYKDPYSCGCTHASPAFLLLGLLPLLRRRRQV